jgi:hypothetical protein
MFYWRNTVFAPPIRYSLLPLQYLISSLLAIYYNQLPIAEHSKRTIVTKVLRLSACLASNSPYRNWKTTMAS